MARRGSRSGLAPTIAVSVPEVEDIKPTVYLANFKARQKHRLVVFGEKTSLADVVKPLCDQLRRRPLPAERRDHRQPALR